MDGKHASNAGKESDVPSVEKHGGMQVANTKQND